MLNVEDIDINNKEAIAFLRTALVQFFEKHRDYQMQVEKDNKERIARIKGDISKIQTPEESAKKQTIFNNIAFFIGSLVAPEITPSKFFGKQKVDSKEKENYDFLISVNNDFIATFRLAYDAAVETILAYNKAISNINSSDEAVIKLFVEINNQYKMEENLNKAISPFINAMFNCGYYNPEAEDIIRKGFNTRVDLRDDIYLIINEYMNKYGSDTMQKGR